MLYTLAAVARVTFKRKKSKTILLVGLPGAGKTALFYQVLFLMLCVKGAGIFAVFFFETFKKVNSTLCGRWSYTWVVLATQVAGVL